MKHRIAARVTLALLLSVRIDAALAQPAAPEDMVEVPGGAFTMGSDSGPPDERPAHRVDLPAFRIDRFPVTHARFTQFLDAVGAFNAKGERLFDFDDPDARDGREDPAAGAVRGTRGGGHDSPAEEITATQRGRALSRNPRSGHHNIGFRCAQ